MKRTQVALAVAALLYGIAWFLPISRYGTTLAEGTLPGWEAFWLSLGPIWDRDPDVVWWQSVISVLSGLSNGWFLFTVAALTSLPRVSRRVLVRGTMLCALVNAQWFLLSNSSDRADLRIGYFLWLTSFLVLVWAAYGTMKTAVDSTMPRQAA